MTDASNTNDLTIIGRAERVVFVDHSDAKVAAKVDTGADISSVWASQISEKDGQLKFRLFGPESECYTGKVISLPTGQYKLTRIANSFGTKELRYVVKLRIFINGRKIVSTFTLANRSKKVYPVLLGRKLLQGKFLVDVSQGEPLVKAEKQKLATMQVELSQFGD